MDSITRKIADQLSRARESTGLTLQQLANLADVAPSTIQKIEAGTMMPSIAVMMKIAHGLHRKIGFFLDEEDGSAEVNLVRKRDRTAADGADESFSVQSLTGDLVDPEMDGFMLTLPPGAHSGEEMLHHRGDELVFCVRGKASFTIGGNEYALGPGDSLHFKSDQPHSWKNPGRSKTELIIICSLPALSEKSILKSATAARNLHGSDTKE
jgi:transcriptional regulator with XRE-family HTH domain